MMRSTAAIGSMFAACVLLGFFGGLWAARSSGRPLLAVAGLFAGVFIGGSVAVRALWQAGK